MKTRNCLLSLGERRFRHRGEAYFHNFESRERGDHHRPGRPPDLSGLACLLVLNHDVDLQDDSLAINVLEFREGVLGDIDSLLEDPSATRSLARRGAKPDRQTYLVRLARCDVHHS